MPFRAVGGLHATKGFAALDAAQRAFTYCEGVCSQYRCPGGLCMRRQPGTIPVGKLTCRQIPNDDRFQCTVTVAVCECKCKATIFEEPAPSE